MKLETSVPPEATIGQPVAVTARVHVVEPGHVAFAGIKISAVRPCDRLLVIEQREVFCKGKFEPGTYERVMSVPLPPGLVPSSTSRGVGYKVTLYARVPLDGDPAGTQEFITETPITLIDVPRPDKVLQANPVGLTIKGLKLSLQKDIFRPGETIKVSFEARDMKELKVLLMQRANILCNCTQYGRVCTQVPKIPPSAAGASKASNPTNGFLLLTVPSTGELSARHDWEPKDKSAWSDKFGDYNEWYLSVLGTKFNGEEIRFEIPIEVDQGRLTTEPAPDVAFFEQLPVSGSLEPPGPRPLFQSRKLSARDPARDGGMLSFTVVNETREPLHGCTVRVTGLKDMFFETAPYMVGLGTILPGQEVRVDGVPAPAGTNEFTLDFDSNHGKSGHGKLIT